MVTASAPGKLMLFGEHAVVFGYPCMVTAVDQRVYVTVEKNGDDVLFLEAPDLGLMAYSKTISDLGNKDVPRSVAFIEMLYRRFLERYPQKQGVVVKTRSDFSSSFGFGSSSAVTVAFAKALTVLYGIELDNYQLFDLCYRAVIDVQGVGSGFDIASAIWGGTIYYVPPAKVVDYVDLDGMQMVVGYTKIKADTATIVRMVAEMRTREPERIDKVMKEISLIVEDAKKVIAQRDWKQLGLLMTRNQQLLAQLQVSGDKLDQLIDKAQKNGAYGAKLSGAGGGDCMIAMANGNRKKVEEAICKTGGEIIAVKLSAEGVRVDRTALQVDLVARMMVDGEDNRQLEFTQTNV